MNAYAPITARWIGSLVVLLVAGCGGGGGDGAGGGGPPVVYSGNSNAAVISGTNATKLVVNVFGIGSGDTPAVMSGLSMQGGSFPNSDSKALTDVAPILKRVSRHTLGRANGTSPARRAISGVAVDETEPCDGGNGSARITGNLNVDGTGTLTTTFSNCLLDGNTVNGQTTMRVDRADLSIGEPTDFTISFPRLSVRGPGVSFDIGGSQRRQVDIATNTETDTENSVALDNLTGQMRMADNLVSVSMYDNIRFPSSSIDSMTGRIYHSVHGFVDVDTPAPLHFASLTQEFPGSGQLLLTGSGNGSIRVTAVSTAGVATGAVLALDLDGNNTFETSATLKWTDLTGPVGADIGDRDGDGMHNAWEAATGLNPDNPGDAAFDQDGDGASNLTEYRAGTHPGSAASVPPVVGLSLSMRDTPDPVVPGGNLTYFVFISDPSVNSSENVVVTVALPANVSLASPPQPTQGSCSGTTPIICNFGTVVGSASLEIVASPTAEGLIRSTASVTTTSFDRNPTTTARAPRPRWGSPCQDSRRRLTMRLTVPRYP